MLSHSIKLTVAITAGSLIAGACGSSRSSSGLPTASPPPSTGAQAPAGGVTGASTSTSTVSGAAAAPAALSAEAQSAATGDIPDNQVFLVFHNRRAGYSMKYPEGWTRRDAAGNVTFQDKNNIVHVEIARGAAPTPSSVRAQLAALKRSTPNLTFTTPQPIKLGPATAIKSTYTTQSRPNPVTGKRVTLIVDRYELAHAGRTAVVDLGTPKGVDNVDAYRLMIESFGWQ